MFFVNHFYNINFSFFIHITCNIDVELNSNPKKTLYKFKRTNFYKTSNSALYCHKQNVKNYIKLKCKKNLKILIKIY